MDAMRPYFRHGYAALPGFVPEPVARAFAIRLKADFARSGIALNSQKKASPLLAREAIEVYGFHYAPMAAFHWGMTPAIEGATGLPLLPTYSYFRIYRQGDICRIHVDRPACEHSVSLLLATSDGAPWPLEVGTIALGEPVQLAEPDFGAEPSVAVPMSPGDAVLYQGVRYKHGRTIPNPNRWSAHLFMHWVDRNGAYADQAFDTQALPDRFTLDLA